MTQVPEHEKHRCRAWDLLNRPFVVVFLGGILAAGLTHLWQKDQLKLESVLAYEQAVAARQIALFGELPSSFQMSVGILNDRFARLLSIAEERNNDNRSSEIKRMMDEMRNLEMKYHNAPSQSATIGLVSSLFRCKSVITKAADLDKSWKQFWMYFQDINRAWNKKRKLDTSEIAKAKAFRKTSVDDMNQHVSNLLYNMGLEIKTAREGSICQGIE